MKIFRQSLIVLMLGLSISCSYKGKEAPVQKTMGYDSITAYEYGADDYGMKVYVMAFLKRGPTNIKDSLKAAELQKGHLENINRLAEQKKLILAGPFLDTGLVRGIFVLNVDNIQKARLLIETDPAIKSGSLDVDLKLWYGPAALMEVNERNQELAKKSIIE